MSKHKIRKNKVCQNCGAFVESNFCPKCGQENSESRQSFHHLFTHFIFDFIHYDSSFWRTTKLLFLSPGKLSVEYMKGKRKSYVNPFTLYIFISFAAFFIPTLLPTISDADGKKTEKVAQHNKGGKQLENNDITTQTDNDDEIELFDDTSAEEVAFKLDSLYRTRSAEKQIISPDNKVYKTLLAMLANIKDKDRLDKAIDFFTHNIPKVLFVYMPFFAFWLWVFHNKKKRYYFDSGIFTLHFFSVVLLTISIGYILMYLIELINTDSALPEVLLYSFSFFYITFYFFRGNRVFYGERRAVSNIKSFFLMGINTFFIAVTFLLYLMLVIYLIYA
ncbi:DUF3667 domain-containing protein [Dysgonomonas sp. 521]|uniref:DUF3667 domain-containing protein n=1 Tax=Dysgonomonas sp. 521 TaxID=2302932 RepID=UPI0013D23FA6|nr:DUF3667 domain-containing protein [Dysgonomonas sp. 521]NDV93334.1 DUF3667 domain-containing protein [Dysgonomonas sp. 521]